MIKIEKDCLKSILIVYVEDIIIIGDDIIRISYLKDKIKQKSKSRDLRELKFFLKMEIARSKDGIFIDERKRLN